MQFYGSKDGRPDIAKQCHVLTESLTKAKKLQKGVWHLLPVPLYRFVRLHLVVVLFMVAAAGHEHLLQSSKQKGV